MAIRGHRASGASGAALVKLALLAPAVFLIVAAVIDLGLTLGNLIAVRGGVASGAREGSVGEFGMPCPLNPLSGAPSENVRDLMCTVKRRIGIAPAKVFVKVAFQPADGLLVCAQTPLTSLTGLNDPFLKGRFLRSKALVRMVEDAGETGGAERAPAGSDWRWCA